MCLPACLQVAAAHDVLSGLSVQLSSSRVAGFFMLTNLQQLSHVLQEVEVQLALVAKHEGCVGVAGHLLQVQAIQQEALHAIKVSTGCCHSSEQPLLYYSILGS